MGRTTSKGAQFWAHYGEQYRHGELRLRRIHSPGRAHENGDVGSSHGGLKNVVDQRLRLHGSRDFESLEAYWACIEALASERNAGREVRFR